MIKTLRESKAKLSELVEQASQGEDVLITVRGRVKARLTRATAPAGNAEMQNWVSELRALQSDVGTGRHNLSSEDILNEDRGDRG